MESKSLLWLFLSSLVCHWCYSRLTIASAVTTATTAICRWTSDASQYLSLVSDLQPPLLRRLTPWGPLPKSSLPWILLQLHFCRYHWDQVPPFYWIVETSLPLELSCAIMHWPNNSTLWSRAHMPTPNLCWRHPWQHQCHINLSWRHLPCSCWCHPNIICPHYHQSCWCHLLALALTFSSRCWPNWAFTLAGLTVDFSEGLSLTFSRVDFLQSKC